LRSELAEGVVAPVDAEAFRQMLLNLLDNAVKYGPPGQVVTVGLAAGDGRARRTVRHRAAARALPPRRGTARRPFERAGMMRILVVEDNPDLAYGLRN